MNEGSKDANIKNLQFYKGKKVLITGHTGFKGAWLTAVLHYMQADAWGYALAPEAGSLYEKLSGDKLIHSVTGDLLDGKKLQAVVREFQPEIVIHLAAFGFMKECFENPVRAYSTNLMGSVNLLEAVRGCPSVKSIVMVSTDKVYENKGDGAIYKETDTLGGEGPYSSSKTCMELLVRDYKKSYFQTENPRVGIATVRASNVLAGGDHIQTRLIPSILRAVAEKTNVELRNPFQTRPWQFVLDALDGYLTVARYLYQYPNEYSGAWNIGPTQNGIRTVEWVFHKIKEYFHGLESMEGGLFEVCESATLGLDIQKSLECLDWEPKVSCDRLIELIVEFFKGQQEGIPEYVLCRQQIAMFYAD